MPPPIKKRQTMKEEGSWSDTSSEPSFDSPVSKDGNLKTAKEREGNDDDNAVDDGSNGASIVGKTFQVPALNGSQESAVTWSSPGLGTQPPSRTRTPKHPALEAPNQQQPESARKKRKLSLSPSDSLAQSGPRQLQLQEPVDHSMVAGDDKMAINSPRNQTTSESSPKRKSSASDSSSTQKKALPKASKVSSRVDSIETALPSNEVSSINVPSKAEENTPPSMPVSKMELKQDHGSVSSKGSKELSKSKARVTPKSKEKKTPEAVAPVNSEESISSNKSLSKTKTAARTVTPDKVVGKQEETSTKTKSSKKRNGAAPKASKDDSAQSLSSVTQADSVNSNGKSQTKKKKKKRSFQDELLNLLFMSCKPYSVKGLAQQLKTNEASVNFCLLSLVDKEWVHRKEFSSKSGDRTKELYWANQECTAKELLDCLELVPPNEIQQARKELEQLQKQQMELSKELSVVSKELSTAELGIRLKEQENEIQALEVRLQETRARVEGASQAPQGGTKPTKLTPLGNSKRFPKQGKQSTKPMDSTRLKRKINEMRLEWKNRKEKCIDFVEQLADGMEKKVKDVIKLLELETDEMVGVKIPPKHML